MGGQNSNLGPVSDQLLTATAAIFLVVHEDPFRSVDVHCLVLLLGGKEVYLYYKRKGNALQLLSPDFDWATTAVGLGPLSAWFLPNDSVSKMGGREIT
jgi:hypothetical protein